MWRSLTLSALTSCTPFFCKLSCTQTSNRKQRWSKTTHWTLAAVHIMYNSMFFSEVTTYTHLQIKHAGCASTSNISNYTSIHTLLSTVYRKTVEHCNNIMAVQNALDQSTGTSISHPWPHFPPCTLQKSASHAVVVYSQHEPGSSGGWSIRTNGVQLHQPHSGSLHLPAFWLISSPRDSPDHHLP